MLELLSLVEALLVGLHRVLVHSSFNRDLNDRGRSRPIHTGCGDPGRRGKRAAPSVVYHYRPGRRVLSRKYLMGKIFTTDLL